MFGLSLVFRKRKQDLTENLMRSCNHFDPRPGYKNSKDVTRTLCWDRLGQLSQCGLPTESCYHYVLNIIERAIDSLENVCLLKTRRKRLKRHKKNLSCF